MKIAPRSSTRTRVELVQDPPDVEVKCAECGGPMRLHRALDAETFEVKWLFWSCARYPVCKCTHSAHGDGMPMGTPANKATRDARHFAHLVFDRLWKRGGHMSRGGAYTWLTEMFGTTEQIHIGNMTIEECEKIVRWSHEKFRALEQERAATFRGKKMGGRVKKQRKALFEDRAYRAERQDRKLERQQRSDPPAAPEPEPEEEPPDMGMVCETLATG